MPRRSSGGKAKRGNRAAETQESAKPAEPSEAEGRLESALVIEYVRRITDASTREQLTSLEEEIWRKFGRGEGATVNALALASLRARILERRATLDASPRG